MSMPYDYNETWLDKLLDYSNNETEEDEFELFWLEDGEVKTKTIKAS